MKKILEHFTISNFKLVIKSLIFRFIPMWFYYHNQACKRLDDSKPIHNQLVPFDRLYLAISVDINL